MSNFPEQGSPEWFQLRRGLFTGSEIENILKPKGLGATGETYIYQKIAELISDPEYDIQFSNEATRWGQFHEETAAYTYAKRTGLVIEEIGFQVHEELKYLGASPDRRVYDKHQWGVAEIKCPFAPENHLKHCLIDSPEDFKSEFPKYYWQCVCEFVCTPFTEFVDFVSFDPRMNKAHRFFRFRFVPSKTDQEFLLTRAREARAIMNTLCSKLNIPIN